LSEHEHEPTWVQRTKRRAWIAVGFGLILLALVFLLLYLVLQWAYKVG
jgi:hypothetical protein